VRILVGCWFLYSFSLNDAYLALSFQVHLVEFTACLSPARLPSWFILSVFLLQSYTLSILTQAWASFFKFKQPPH
jgi:hypothetical protein